MTNSSFETIFALSSAPGRAGVSVVRITGRQTRNVVTQIAGRLPEPRRATLRTFRDPQSHDEIDRGLCLWLPGPKSFTGEDCAEFHVHGGPAVISAVLSALSHCEGCRLAEPGEFSRRAFAHGKLDLAQAEGIADLIAAETEAQRHQALAQVGGALSDVYDAWRTRLIEASALTEAAIDFSDESDVASNAIDRARTVVDQVLPEIQAHLDDAHCGEILRDGFKVVLVGSPNVGKSSLLNALARRDVVIVSPEAGTTRDVVEVRLDLNGYPVILSDTAGLREEAGDVEREGMRRARDAAKQAQLVLVLQDQATGATGAGQSPENIENSNIINVLTKIDLVEAPSSEDLAADIAVSAKTGAGLPALIQLIANHVENALAHATAAPLITQLRHRQAVEQCASALGVFLQGDQAHAELRAEDLRQAIAALGRITGRVDVEDILDQVFGQFCIGK